MNSRKSGTPAASSHLAFLVTAMGLLAFKWPSAARGQFLWFGPVSGRSQSASLCQHCELVEWVNNRTHRPFLGACLFTSSRTVKVSSGIIARVAKAIGEAAHGRLYVHIALCMLMDIIFYQRLSLSM